MEWPTLATIKKLTSDERISLGISYLCWKYPNFVPVLTRLDGRKRPKWLDADGNPPRWRVESNQPTKNANKIGTSKLEKR